MNRMLSETSDVVDRLRIALLVLEDIVKHVDDTGPWNAEFGLSGVRIKAQIALEQLTSPYLLEEEQS